LNPPTPARPEPPAQRRVHALVALRLLQIVKSQDIPLEVLEDEDPTITMPRRLGLSEVVDRQIRSYRQDVRKRVRLPDQEIHDLFRLVLRRPDAGEIFLRLGRLLAGDEESTWWTKRLPRRVAMAVARRRVARRLRALFGRRMGGFGRGGFTVEGRSLLFFEADPGGDACALVTGLCSSVLERTTGAQVEVDHIMCQSRDDALCRWEGTLIEGGAAPAALTPDAAVS
jgi:hypothetical protein